MEINGIHLTLIHLSRMHIRKVENNFPGGKQRAKKGKKGHFPLKD
jgi:hypothetical protein